MLFLASAVPTPARAHARTAAAVMNRHSNRLTDCLFPCAMTRSFRDLVPASTCRTIPAPCTTGRVNAGIPAHKPHRIVFPSRPCAGAWPPKLAVHQLTSLSQDRGSISSRGRCADLLARSMISSEFPGPPLGPASASPISRFTQPLLDYCADAAVAQADQYENLFQ